MTGNNTTANATHAANESTLSDSSSHRTNIDARIKLLYLIVCNVLVMGLNTRSTLAYHHLPGDTHCLRYVPEILPGIPGHYSYQLRGNPTPRGAGHE